MFRILAAPAVCGMVKEADLKVTGNGLQGILKGLICAHMPNFFFQVQRMATCLRQAQCHPLFNFLYTAFFKEAVKFFFAADRKGQICGTGKEAQKETFLC